MKSIRNTLSGMKTVFARGLRPQKRTLPRETENRRKPWLEAGILCANPEETARFVEQTLRAVLSETEASVGYLMRIEETRHTLTTEYGVCLGTEREIPTKGAVGEGLEGIVAETAKPLNLSRLETGKQKHLPARMDDLYTGQAALCIPLFESGADGRNAQVIGTLTLLHVTPEMRFSPADVELTRTAGGSIATALVNTQFYQKQMKTFTRTLQQIATHQEGRNVYSQGHASRVAEVSALIAEKMRLDEETIQDLRTGALLHEIGKIGIPDSILHKPGQLTEEEFQALRWYPVIGYEMCSPLGISEEVLLLIRSHAERLDGTGYPDGLKQNDLPLPVRILSVADAFDAMSSYRPYREAMDARARQEQLNRFAGTQFDPIIVEVLKGLFNAGALDELYRDQWQPHEEQSPFLRAA